MMHPPRFEHMFSYIEIISILIVIFACFFIFFKTREIYSLTSHKGIGYFRKAFLFFGFGFVLFLVHFIVGPYFFFRGFFRFVMMFNLIGILYFLFSLFYKKLRYEWLIYVFSFFAVLSTFFIRSKLYLGVLVFCIFMVIGVVSVKNYLLKCSKKGKKNKIGTHIYLIYSLLFGLWIFHFLINLFDLNSFFGREVASLSTALVFVYISWIVLKKLSISRKIK